MPGVTGNLTRLSTIGRPGSPPRRDPSFRINLSSLIAATEYSLRSDVRFQLGESLVSGALVFEAKDGPAGYFENLQVRGSARGAVVLLSGTQDYDRTSTFGHELVHVIQADLATRLITAPLEQYLWRRVGLTAPFFETMELSDGLQPFNRHPFLPFLEAEADRLQP